MRKVAEDTWGGFEYYQDPETGTVYYDGRFSGRKSGAFGPAEYWAGHVYRVPVVHGPWQFLDTMSRESIMGEIL